MKERFSVPYVGAIIERQGSAEKEILLQTRNKPGYDPKYTGALEIPAGRIRAYEDIFEALKREVEEETGLKVKRIYENKTQTFKIKGDENFAFEPFCCAQVTKGPHPYIGFYFVCEVKKGKLKPQASETTAPKWIKVSKLRKMLKEELDKFYILHVAALNFYINKQK